MNADTATDAALTPPGDTHLYARTQSQSGDGPDETELGQEEEK